MNNFIADYTWREYWWHGSEVCGNYPESNTDTQRGEKCKNEIKRHGG